MQAKARPLALGAGTSSRRESSASTQASILSVLQASGASPLTFLSVGDLDLEARELEPVVDETRSVHRLDSGAHRTAVGRQAAGEAVEPVGVRRRGADLDGFTVAIEQW